MPSFVMQRRVEFGDTDMAGIVHFSNFFRYMEAAETRFLNTLGISVAWIEDGTHVGFPRVSVGCDYIKPARFEDTLDIEVIVEKVGRKSISYRFDFRRNGEPVAVGRMTSVFCRASAEHGMESLEISDSLRSKLLG